MSDVTQVTTTLRKVERKAKKKEHVPVTEDPRTELRRLVREHRNLTKLSVSLHHMQTDKIVRTGPDKGKKIPNGLPEDMRGYLLEGSKMAKGLAKALEPKMTIELRKLPIFALFLAKVFGIGPVVAAYLVSELDPHKGEKISNWRRFCGLAVINGRLERRQAGVKSAYNSDIRVRLYQAMTAMYKNAAKKSEARPNGTTTKYLDVWLGVKHREMSSERVNVAENKWMDAKGEWRGGARAHAHSKGWHKAADVFVEDLYIVWRAMEGLPVWPSYYAAKLGYNHGGSICVNAPKMLTLDEALVQVGDVGGRPAAAPIVEDDGEVLGLDEEEAMEVEAIGEAE